MPQDAAGRQCTCIVPMQLILGSLPGHRAGPGGQREDLEGRTEATQHRPRTAQPWTQLCPPSLSTSYGCGDVRGSGSTDNPRSLITAVLTDESTWRHLSPGAVGSQNTALLHTPPMHACTCPDMYTCTHMCTRTHMCVCVHTATSSLTNKGHPWVCLALCPGQV